MKEFKVKQLDSGRYRLRVYDRWLIFRFFYDVHYSYEKDEDGLNEILDLINEYGNHKTTEKTV